MLLHQTCQLTMWNFISQLRLLHCRYNIYALYSVVMLLQLQHICLLDQCYCHQHRCCSNILTGWMLLQDEYLLDCGHSIIMPADLLPLNIACLLALCFSICYTFWCGASLSAVPAGMVSQYQPCLLAWFFIIGHAFWFGTSLTAMHVSVVPYYRTCLLLWYLPLVRLALQPTFWLVECRGKRRGYKSGATLKEVPLHETCLLIRCYSQTWLLVQCNSIWHACWVHLFRYTCL